LTFFLDANVFIYSAEAGPTGEACGAILREVGAGRADGTSSVGAIEEVWHFELSRPGFADGLTANILEAISTFLPVTEEALALALQFDVARPGANDRLHVATCVLNEIEVVVTADRDFDEFDEIQRVDPLDADAVAELLAA
jgi:predicted nucleic acid-binding protein